MRLPTFVTSELTLTTPFLQLVVVFLLKLAQQADKGVLPNSVRALVSFLSRLQLNLIHRADPRIVISSPRPILPPVTPFARIDARSIHSITFNDSSEMSRSRFVPRQGRGRGEGE